MNYIQSNITRYTKKQENMTTHNEKRNQSKEKYPELIVIQMIELVNKDIKTDIVTIFHMSK